MIDKLQSVQFLCSRESWKGLTCRRARRLWIHVLLVDPLVEHFSVFLRGDPDRRGAYFRMMATMKGSILLSFSVFVLLVTQTARGQVYNTSASITPPSGNSPKIVAKTVSAYLVYTCVQGDWVPGKGYATLVDEKTNQVIGNYTRTADKNGYLGTWTLTNSPGDREESGYVSSVVSGRLLASSSVGAGKLPDQLMEAASHLYAGIASTISYVQMYNITRGVPPPKEKCLVAHTSVTVPFHAEFCLWTQDPIPASVPGPLVAPGRFVENLFGKGYITYIFNGSGWIESGRVSTLHSMPGTPAVGQFTLTNGIECWDLSGPSGLLLYGKRLSPEVKVVPNACAWSLSKVTSASGALINLGPFSHVQTVSTRGGIAPSLSDTQNPALGATRAVPFSAIYCLYAE